VRIAWGGASLSQHKRYTYEKIVPDPPRFFPYLSISPDLTPEAARTEATSLMGCLREVLDMYFDTNSEEQRQTLLNTCIYLNQLLYPLIRHETGAQP
jgi:hypothetical protein